MGLAAGQSWVHSPILRLTNQLHDLVRVACLLPVSVSLICELSFCFVFKCWEDDTYLQNL